MSPDATRLPNHPTFIQQDFFPHFFFNSFNLCCSALHTVKSIADFSFLCKYFATFILPLYFDCQEEQEIESEREQEKIELERERERERDAKREREKEREREREREKDINHF